MNKCCAPASKISADKSLKLEIGSLSEMIMWTTYQFNPDIAERAVNPQTRKSALQRYPYVTSKQDSQWREPILSLSMSFVLE